jgi:hypothetical protein
MYYLSEHSIVSLFDSRASHDFISLACAQKTNLSLKKTEVPYLVLTPEGRVVANRMVHKIPLELAGQMFPTNLLILEGQGINIILGMRSIKMHKALLDISTRLVHLEFYCRQQGYFASTCRASSSDLCARHHGAEPRGKSHRSGISGCIPR